MSKSRYIQPGHLRHYSESGKTIEVNGGPKQQHSVSSSLDVTLAIGIFVVLFLFLFFWMGSMLGSYVPGAIAIVVSCLIFWLILRPAFK